MALQGSDKAGVGTESSGSKESRKECNECGEDIVKEKVECEVCERWFHLKCAGVATGTYKALVLDKALHWYCVGCSRGVVNTWKKLQEKQEKMEKEVADLKVEVKGMKDLFSKFGKMEVVLENNKREWKDLSIRVKKAEEADKEILTKKEQKVLKEIEDMKISFKGIVKEQELDKEKELKNKDKELQQKMYEVMEREKRRYNLIIRGIKESKSCDEKVEVERILDTLVPEARIEYKIVGRIGRTEIESEGKENRSRPLRIRIEDIDQKRRLLSRGKKLKEAEEVELRRVYLAPDLTRMQQDEDKKLRDKLKELRDIESKKEKGKKNVKITKGEIVSEENGVTEVLFSLEK